MKFGIIGAMEEEIVLLKSKMTTPKEWRQANALFISGEIEGHQVVLVHQVLEKLMPQLQPLY